VVVVSPVVEPEDVDAVVSLDPPVVVVVVVALVVAVVVVVVVDSPVVAGLPVALADAVEVSLTLPDVEVVGVAVDPVVIGSPPELVAVSPGWAFPHPVIAAVRRTRSEAVSSLDV
jgi:hypothetical protein